MLAFIHGEITDITEDAVIIDNQGIGYKLFMNLRDLSTLEMGQRVKVHTEMIVREDDLSLFGFLNTLDRKLFNKMRSVSGIGTKTALNILSVLSAREVIQLVIEEQQSFLTQVPGIGKKTAARIIMELKDHFMKEFGEQYDTSFDNKPSKERSPKLDEVRSALQNMGYSRQEIGMILTNLDAEASVEEMLKEAFRLMARW